MGLQMSVELICVRLVTPRCMVSMQLFLSESFLLIESKQSCAHKLLVQRPFDRDMSNCRQRWRWRRSVGNPATSQVGVPKQHSWFSNFHIKEPHMNMFGQGLHLKAPINISIKCLKNIPHFAYIHIYMTHGGLRTDSRCSFRFCSLVKFQYRCCFRIDVALNLTPTVNLTPDLTTTLNPNLNSTM